MHGAGQSTKLDINSSHHKAGRVQLMYNLVPGPPRPDFISQPWRKKKFLHGCGIKSGRGRAGMRLLMYST